MGLDMYLMRRAKNNEMDMTHDDIINRFISWVSSFSDCTFESFLESKFSIDELPDTKKLVKAIEKRFVSFRDEEVYYWRKANAIHKWFVDNVQDGADDCQKHRAVTKEDLEKLRTSCKAVLDNHALAEEVLPAMPGFFFGRYDYDEHYFQDIARTMKVCDKLIRDFDFENYDLFYCSDW